MSLPQDEDASGHPKAATQQRRAILLIHRKALPDLARAQATALQEKLPDGLRVFAVAYPGPPAIAEALQRVDDLGLEAVIAVSMHPAYSRTTTQPLARELYRRIEQSGCVTDVTMRGIWYDDAGYVNAQARLLHEHAGAHGLTPADTHLVYAARSIPAADADAGDPYPDQVHRTAELVSRRLGWPADRSALGYLEDPETPEGLGPTVSDVLAELSPEGASRILVCPLDIAEACRVTPPGGGQLFVCPPLGTSEPFVAALRNLVLHGRHPVSFGGVAAGLMAETRSRRAAAEGDDAPIESLVMVGMSLGGRLGPGRGPDMTAADGEAFRRIKKRQCDVPDVLRAVCQDEAVREAWIWNTCRRFELYGWLRTAMDT
ncbi:MAG: ferrochelatase, partial [Planctomycetota bacterium]